MENFKGTKGKWRTHVIDGRNSTYFSIESANARVCNISSKRIELFKEEQANAQLIAHAPEMLKKHYEEIEILEDILKNNPIGDVAFKLRMIIESKKELLTRATTI